MMHAADSTDKFLRMTRSPVEPLICRLAVPTIISSLVTTFYNVADTYFIGKISTSASAAVGVSFSLMAVIQAIGFFSVRDRGTTSPGSSANSTGMRRRFSRRSDFSPL